MSTTTEDPGRREFLKRALALFAYLVVPKVAAQALKEPGNFAAVYSDTELRDRFFLFLQNVYRIYPEAKFHQLILETSEKHGSDEAVYKALLEKLPELKPLAAELRYQLPALKKQKEELTEQTIDFVGKGPVTGLLEIGSPARYASALRKKIKVKGPIYVVNDVKPSYGLPDLMERGRLRKLGKFVPMGDYDPFGADKIPDASLDLVTNFIGLHHCPNERIDGFTASIRRALKPGGRLLHRDHDVDSPQMTRIVALAHDVFNCGLMMSWKENAAQLRLWRSVRDWTAYFESRGFKRTERTLAQKNDPTKNLLLEFVKA